MNPIRRPMDGNAGVQLNRMPVPVQRIPQPNQGQVRAQVPGGFPIRPNNPQQAPPQQEQFAAIVKAKAILPHLKESLVNLMAVASHNFEISVKVDGMQKVGNSSNIPRFDKSLEHFYSLCDQLEVQLNLAYHQLTQALVGTQHAPLMMNVNFKTDPNGPQLYGNYVQTVEHQLIYAKEIHDSLLNCCTKLTEQQTTHPTLPAS